MTPGQLFFRRLQFEWKFQYRVLKTVIDWTVALYIVIPAIGLVIYQYYEWWHTPPGFLPLIPSQLFLAVLFLFCWASSVRVFIEEGDQLFLFSLSKWLNGIVMRGLIYSYLKFLVTSLIFFAAFVPLALMARHFTFAELLRLFPVTVLAKIILGLSRQFLALRFQGWRAIVLNVGMLIISGFLFIRLMLWALSSPTAYGLILLVLTLIAAYLSRKRLYYRGNFFRDIDRELEERLKYVGAIVGMSGVKVRKKRRKSRRPWLFRNSGRIFRAVNPISGLIELALKSTLRNRQNLVQYAQILSIMVAFLFMVPVSLKFICFFVFIYVFNHFIGSLWAEVVAEESFPLIRWQEEHLLYAKQKFVTIVALPAVIIMGLVVALPYFMSFI